MKKIFLAFLISTSLYAADDYLPATSMGATFSSPGKSIASSAFALQLIYTGSPVGTAKIQVSNDCATWEDLDDASVAISASGSTLFNVQNAYYDCVRITYTRTSGTGSMLATISTKVK